MPNSKHLSLKVGKLFWAGLILILSYPISGIVSFALVATLIGETALESDTGQMTTLGNLSQLVPVILGIGLIGVDLIYRPKIKSLSVWVTIAGIILVVASLLAIMQQPPGTGGGPNIGAGILLMVGIALSLAGMAGSVIGINRKPANN
jgi:hypothetical protein